MGSTATGKTDMAVELTRHFPMEIISVDSAMVYKDMNIGTAKPTADILQNAPHRLIDICDPKESYSAARFRTDALREIKMIEADRKIPLLVGGTGLYFRTLEEGISILPEADSSIRTQLDAERRQSGLAALYERLKAIDPGSAERIDANDPQRIQRALEVFEISGKTMSELFEENQSERLDRDIIKIILLPQDRKTHRQVVEQRFLQMLEHGLLDEVQQLFERGDLTAELPAMRMVGYRQVWRYLEGELEYEEMKKHAIIATRQLAKRQTTWLRKEQNGQFLDSQGNEKFSKVKEVIINYPLTG